MRTYSRDVSKKSVDTSAAQAAHFDNCLKWYLLRHMVKCSLKPIKDVCVGLPFLARAFSERQIFHILLTLFFYTPFSEYLFHEFFV